MLKIPIHYVGSPEEAQDIRAKYKKLNQKVYIFISGKEDIKNNLKDFIKARTT
jgi:chaperonin cofactor prefoldin